MKSPRVTIQMKPIAVLSCGTVYYTVQSGSNFKFVSLDKILKCALQMKTIEPYFPVVPFIMLYKVVLTFEFVDKIPTLLKQYFPLAPFLTILYKVV